MSENRRAVKEDKNSGLGMARRRPGIHVALRSNALPSKPSEADGFLTGFGYHCIIRGFFMKIGLLSTICFLALSGAAFAQTQNAPAARRRPNVIIFVADGLRHGSVNAQDAPTLWAVRTRALHFENSHSLFPTFTTANAAAIATGHGLGDTGDFSNTIYTGYPVFDTGNFASTPGSPTPFIENDQVLADLDDHFQGNYLGEKTLLELAREHGYNTAAVGKLGPVGIQDAAALSPRSGLFQFPTSTLFVDDTSGSSAGPALSPELSARLLAENLPTEAPTRTNGFGPSSPYNNGNSGDSSKPGTLWANNIHSSGLPMWPRAVFCLCLPLSLTSPSPWCTGRAIPMEHSTIKVTVWARSIRASMA